MSKRSDLAVRAANALATSRDRVKGSDLADALGTSAGFLSQALTPLVRAGWIQSDPGPSGGYRLAVDAEQLSVLEVIEAVEGPTDSGVCALGNRPCGDLDHCPVHRAWQRARDRLVTDLRTTNVAEVPVGRS